MFRALKLPLLIALILGAGIHGARAQWVSMNGPCGGLASKIVVKDTNLFVILRLAGVFESTNGGESWTEVLANSHVISLAASRNNIIVGTSLGLLVSTDDGASWLSQSLPESAPYLFQIPSEDTVVYAMTDNGTSDLLCSHDGGISWETISGAPVLAATRSGSTLYGVDGVEFFVSSDNGLTWKSSRGGWPEVNASDIATLDHDLFVSTTAGIFVSSDSGASWTPRNQGLKDLWVDMVKVIGDTLYAGTDYVGLFRSTDHGNSWSSISNGITSGMVSDIVVSKNISFIACGQGVFRSDNQGLFWQLASNGMPSLYVRTVCVTSSALFVGTYDEGLYSTTNGGEDWLAAVNGLTDFGVFGLAATSTRMFADTRDSGSFVSTDNGGSWTAVNSGPPAFASFRSTFVMPGTNIVFASGDRGFFVSADGGSGWRQADSGLTGRYISAVAFSGPWVYAATEDSGVFASRDTGMSWNRVSDSLPLNSVSILAGCKGSLVALSKGNLVRSDDSGKTWVPITLPSNASSIVTLLAHRGNLFVSTVGPNQGVYLSTDCGDSWEKVDEGLTQIVLQFAVEGNNIFAATGAGVWRRPLSEMITSVSPPTENIPSRFSLLQNYPNPFNPKTVVSGQWSVTSVVKLAVYDILGREVAVLANGKFPAGKYSFTFDGSNVSSGVYFYRLTAGGNTAIRKMTLIK